MKQIRTNCKEVFSALNTLYFQSFSRVNIKKVRMINIERIFKLINKEEVIVEYEKVGNFYLIKRKLPLNFQLIFAKPKRQGYEKLYLPILNTTPT